MRLLFFIVALLLSVRGVAPAAAPMTVKDVALMVRMGVTEGEILGEVEKRRLLTAIDAQAETTLRSSGMSAALIGKLKSGNYVLTGAEAAAVQRRIADQRAATERQQALDAKAFAARQQQLAGLGARVLIADQMCALLAGKLIKLRGDQIVPFDDGELKHARLFLVYNSAHWCGPCREFTPKLVDFYQRMKPQHPEMEVLFVSSDRDEFNMGNYMRLAHMPWPAVRYDAGAELKRRFCGDSIPWLTVLDDSGKVLVQNDEQKGINAPAILAAVEQKLTETH